MMTAFFVLAVAQNTSWYVFPLAAAISLVYSASRYELTERVIKRGIRLFVTIIGFMFVVLVILWLLSANL
jgi:inner membrane protein involved in colicin E2 resistance